MNSLIFEYLEDVRALTFKYLDNGESRSNLLNHLEGFAQQARKDKKILSTDELERLLSVESLLISK